MTLPASAVADPSGPAGETAAPRGVPLLRVRGVGCAEDDRALDLDIWDGELLCVVGPAGCGKTSLVRMLAGLDRPARGAIAVNGRAAVWGGPSVGFTQAEGSLFPWLTVRQNLWLALHVGRFKAGDPWRVDALLGLLGLLEVANTFPVDLPWPTRRLVELCRALVRDPLLVVLDEPFHGLDFGDRQALAAALERARGLAHKTMVVFTQDVGLAVQLGDRVAVMAASPARIVAAVPVAGARPRRAFAGQAAVLQRVRDLCDGRPA